jgi:hypothetical protein
MMESEFATETCYFLPEMKNGLYSVYLSTYEQAKRSRYSEHTTSSGTQESQLDCRRGQGVSSLHNIKVEGLSGTLPGGKTAVD